MEKCVTEKCVTEKCVTENSVTEKLLSLFEKQLDLQKQLYAEAQRLREQILPRELKQILATAHTIDQITGEIESLELERQHIIKNSDLTEEANGSFSALLRLLPEDDRKQLEKIRSELKSAVKATARINSSNRIILEEALSSVKSSVEIIATKAKPSTGYDFTGKTNSASRRKLVNQIG